LFSNIFCRTVIFFRKSIFCRKQVLSYHNIFAIFIEVPEIIELRQKLPLTTVGKLIKNAAGRSARSALTNCLLDVFDYAVAS